MRVENKYDVKKIILEHDGTREKIGCTFTKAGKVLSSKDLTLELPVIIGFKDIHEVDMLINLLQRFRNGVMMNMGRWERSEEEMHVCATCKNNYIRPIPVNCYRCINHDLWQQKED